MASTQALLVEQQVVLPQDAYVRMGTNSLFVNGIDGYTPFAEYYIPLERKNNPTMKPGAVCEFEIRNESTVLYGLMVVLDFISDTDQLPVFEAFGTIEVTSNTIPACSYSGKFMAVKHFLQYGIEEQNYYRSMFDQLRVESDEADEPPAKGVKRILIPLSLFMENVHTPLIMDAVRNTQLKIKLQLNPSVPYTRAKRDDAWEELEVKDAAGESIPVLDADGNKVFVDENGNVVDEDTTGAAEKVLKNKDSYHPLIKQFVDVKMYGRYAGLCEQEASVLAQRAVSGSYIIFDDMIEVPEVPVVRPALAAGETSADIIINTELSALSSNISCILWVLTAENVTVLSANYRTDIENKQCKSAQLTYNGRSRLMDTVGGYEFTQMQRRFFPRSPYKLNLGKEGQIGQKEVDVRGGKENILSAVHCFSWSFDVFWKQINGVTSGNALEMNLHTTWSFTNTWDVDQPEQRNILQIWGIKKRSFGILGGNAMSLDTPMS